MKLCRTRDLDLVRALITAPGSYDAATDDSAIAAGDFQPNPHPGIWYIIASDDAGDIGLYTLIPQNAVCWELHLTRAFGSRAQRALAELPAWIFRETACRRIVASVPATNKLVLRHARTSGFRPFGRNPRSFQKRGQLIDQILLGISPEDLENQTTCHRP